MKQTTKEFQELQKEWDRRLKESGFEDIEQRSGHLKKWSIKFTLDAEIKMKAKEEYYRMAGHFLHEYKFANAVERRIWELHCQGEGKLRIVKALRAEKLWYKQKDARPRRPCAFSVQYILEHLRGEMAMKVHRDRQNSQE